MFWDDIKLVTEQVQKFGLRKPFVDLGGLNQPVIADYDLTIKTGEQYARYVKLSQRPFEHIDKDYFVINPESGDPPIEELPSKYSNTFGTAVCLNVIEHIENPFQVFQAFYEIMKPNSLLIISTVFLFPYHPSPRDYWRYTPECLSYLAKNVGFTVLESNWRLNISANQGVKNIHNNELQEIRSVFVILTKCGFEDLPVTVYALPKRVSVNGLANQFIALEETTNELSRYIEQYSQAPTNQLAINNLCKVRKQIAKQWLDCPSEQLARAYYHDLGRIHKTLLDSGIKNEPLTEIEQLFSNDIVKNQRQYQSTVLPEWEYLAEGWDTKDTRIKGWNVQSILDVRKTSRSYFEALLQSNESLGKSYETHNTYMAYAYVLALAARKKDYISLLDWGGGIGDYYLLSKAVLPEIEIDYHCKDLAFLCQGGRELLPEVNFLEDEEACFNRSYDLVLASSSLQYSRNWKQVVQQLAAVSRSYLYITRLPIVHQAASFVVVQRPYQYGYQTEYMGWFLNREEFLDYVGSLQMELVREFLIQERPLVHGAPEQGECRGFLFRPQSSDLKT